MTGSDATGRGGPGRARRSAQVDPVEQERPGWSVTLAGLFLAVTVFGFQQTAITPALPVVQDDLGASRTWTTWLLSGYFIVASVTPVFLGKLADRTGKRRILLVALGVFLVGSVGSALAPTIGLVVVCRVVQGLGGAVFPLSFAIVRDELPSGRVSTGIGILTGGFGLGSLGGYAAGGMITQWLGWRWIFWLGAIALSGALVAVVRSVPDSPATVRRGLDIGGAVLFGATLTGVILAVTEGPERGWTDPFTLAMFALAVAAFVGWVFQELSTDEPLMDLRVLASRSMLLTNAASLMSGYAAVGTGVLVTFLLQSGTGAHLTAFGLTAGPLLTGLVLVPRAVGQSVGGPTTGRIVRGFGQGPALMAGLLAMAAGLAGLAFARPNLWMIVAELVVVGAGFGVAVAVMGSLVTLSVDAGETAVANSINAVLRRVGGAIGAQFGVALLATFTVAGTSEPSEGAFTVAFAVGAGAALVGALCAALIARSR